jgi:hypothetical protein
MKKYIPVLLTMFFLVATISAQELKKDSSVLTNKKGIPILPKEGDLAIGFGAGPFLDYLGNMFNNTVNNHLDLTTNTIYGKYYLKNDEAIRIYYTWTNTQQTSKQYVQDDAAVMADPLSQAKVEDVHLYKYNNFGIGLSYQKYRGYGRLQGFYGVYGNYSQSRTQNEYTYGNAITEANPNPTNSWGSGDGEGGRTLYSDNGISNAIGAGLLGGIELFFMPKASIGAEINFGYAYGWSTQSNAKYEKWDGGQVIQYKQIYSPGNHSSNVYTFFPSTYGGLFLMFHF